MTSGDNRASSRRVSLLLALRGLERGNKFTLGLTVIIIGLVFVMLVFQPSLVSGVIQVQNDQIVHYMYGNIALEPKEHREYITDVSRLTGRIDRIPGVIASSPRYVSAAMFTYQGTTLGKTLTSVTPSDETLVLTIPEKMIAGEYLSDGDRDQIVIGSLLSGHTDTTLDKMKSLGGVGVGDTIQVTFSNGAVRTYHVKGIFETQSNAVDQTAFITNKEMESALGLSDQASLVLVKLSSTGDEDKFRTTMLQYGIQEPIKTWTEEGAGPVGDINKSFDLIDSIMIVFSLVIGGIVIFIVVFINTVNKKKQIAIMKAIGVKKEVIINSYMLQVICLCLAGIVFGVILFNIIVYYLTLHPIHFPIGDASPLIDPVWLAKSMAALLLVSLFAGYIPAWKTVNEEILEAMRG